MCLIKKKVKNYVMSYIATVIGRKAILKRRPSTPDLYRLVQQLLGSQVPPTHCLIYRVIRSMSGNTCVHLSLRKTSKLGQTRLRRKLIEQIVHHPMEAAVNLVCFVFYFGQEIIVLDCWNWRRHVCSYQSNLY